MDPKTRYPPIFRRHIWVLSTVPPRNSLSAPGDPSRGQRNAIYPSRNRGVGLIALLTKATLLFLPCGVFGMVLFRFVSMNACLFLPV